ncbi:hypothetical protein AAFF_G00376930 [Aldrovandia affinis]|uniref:Uncharacterized protein n=1 Tax=Aldrovandia affinis TaxID=143900 RepID=A0AAD7SG73_9TELE|nr:hypothetical protein AAFF_G00376930 [Aldrovandia affinis]
MEMDGRGDAPQNTYEGNIRAESLYHNLHLQSPGENNSAVGPFLTKKGSRIVVTVVVILGFLLLSVTLVVVALHYSRSYTLPVMPEHGFGFWHLRDNTFYLPWHGHGDCQAAERFCSQQNATLANSRHRNRDWMMSLARGKQVWVKAESNWSSGFGQSQDEEACSCELLLVEAPDPPMAADCVLQIPSLGLQINHASKV